ncbi:hypothetical protein [Mangrovibacter plantisponsor]|nr:hypothetical protein [Mangrovibacter plantisponsor]
MSQKQAMVITLLSGFSSRVLAIYLKLSLPVFDYSQKEDNERP